MATPIKFRLKTFGKKSQEVIKFVKTPAGIVSTTALGISSANLVNNISKRKGDRKYQDKQIDAMKHLTRSINKLDNTVEKLPAENITKNDTSLISFKPKFLK